jgi:hypothetical protein
MKVCIVRVNTGCEHQRVLLTDEQTQPLLMHRQ